MKRVNDQLKDGLLFVIQAQRSMNNAPVAKQKVSGGAIFFGSLYVDFLAAGLDDDLPTNMVAAAVRGATAAICEAGATKAEHLQRWRHKMCITREDELPLSPSGDR